MLLTKDFTEYKDRRCLMEIALIAVFGLIALAMLTGKSLNITITQKYVNPPLPPPGDSPEDLQKKVDEQAEALRSMDGVIQTLNEYMGVDSNHGNDK
jgi:hypothetical protein